MTKMPKPFVKQHADNYFEVAPILPAGKAGRYGEPIKTITLAATDSEDAVRRAVVSGFIPSNTVMQYFEAKRVPNRR